MNLRDEQGYEWTCADCALAAGGRVGRNQMSTCHEGTCPVCLRERQVLTEVRDYGYPRFSAAFVACRREEARDDSSRR